MFSPTLCVATDLLSKRQKRCYQIISYKNCTHDRRISWKKATSLTFIFRREGDEVGGIVRGIKHQNNISPSPDKHFMFNNNSPVSSVYLKKDPPVFPPVPSLHPPKKRILKLNNIAVHFFCKSVQQTKTAWIFAMYMPSNSQVPVEWLYYKEVQLCIWHNSHLV